MPSESVAGFLDQAKANRVLVPEQVEQLIRQPDIPQTDLTALCQYLEARGVLTRFQADALRSGRGHELTFAGYPVLDELGPCPGGTAFRALHPSLKTPVVLRRFRTDILLPADDPASLVARARAAAGLHHPNLAPPLDAGFHGDQPYAAVDAPADAADLDSLVRQIGPMPAFLAAEFCREIASALRAVHERGAWHGDVRPANMLVAPLTVKTAPDGSTKRRPAPNAAVRLAELGLVPVRPPAASAPPPAEVLAYLPPERIDAQVYDPRGDLYGLGATAYYLLTGKPPFPTADPRDLLTRVRNVDPAPLSALRPDLPAELVSLVMQLLAKRPDARPATASDAEQGFAKFCRPDRLPAGAAASAPAAAVVAHPVGEPVAEEYAEPAPADEWGVDPSSFSTDHADEERAPRPAASGMSRSRMWMWIGIGAGLQLIALLGWLYLAGVFDSAHPQPEPTPVKKDETPKKNTRPKRPA